MSSSKHLGLRLVVLLVAFLSSNHVVSPTPNDHGEGYVTTTRVPLKNNETAIAISNTENDCYNLVMGNQKIDQKFRILGRRNLKKPKMAYRMAILASMAYWEFHKWQLPISGFRLQNDPLSKRQRLRQQACQFVHPRKSFRRYLLRKLLPPLSPYISKSLEGSQYFDNSTNAILGLVNSTFCQQPNSTRVDRHHYTFQYWFYNWYEPALAGVKFHDTDALLSTSDDGTSLVIAFGGTTSPADAFTNIQTFEPANHSSFFNVSGSLHRGFLNAYTRVERGRVMSFSSNTSSRSDDILSGLNTRFGHCTGESKKKIQKRGKKKKDTCGGSCDESSSSSSTMDLLVEEQDEDGSRTSQNKPNNVKEKNSGGCRVRDEKLITILQQVVMDALEDGKTVHLTGHSLGGSLATLMALDILVNFPSIPVSKLHLWTFGAPQIADDIFLYSAMEAAPRLEEFLQSNGRFNRYVTLSDDCKVDAVSELTKNTLATHNPNLHGHAARKLGGVHGHVVHFAEPHYLLTPDQYNGWTTTSTTTTTTKEQPSEGKSSSKSTTRSSFAAHFTINYLLGISRESRDHPLLTDLPLRVKEWLGGEDTSIDNMAAPHAG